MEPDFELRTAVAIEIFGRDPAGVYNSSDPPCYECSLDASREVLRKVEERWGREPFITYLHAPLMDRRGGCTSLMWLLVNVTAKQICEAALKTARDARFRLPIVE